jgi:phosphatidylinositol alpha-1,6-mannosyltransferase
MNERKLPKLLLITRNLPPLQGGMERLLLETIKGLSGKTDLTVIGPKGCTPFLPENVKSLETPTGLIGFLTISLWKSVILCNSERFDLVIGGSGITAPCLALLKRTQLLKTTIFLHGLDLVFPNFIYQKIFVASIRKADLLVANSRNTARLAESKAVPAANIAIINPGCHPPEEDAYRRVSAFQREHRIPSGPIILFVGRITRRKGLSQFIRLCLPEIVKRIPQAQLLVVGGQPANALNRSGEINLVRQAISELSTREQKNIHFIGSVGDAELNTCYALAAVHIFPLQDVPGDVEGFGMVVIEAASYGTPTIAFNIGGVADAITISSGILIPSGDYAAMAHATVKVLRNDNEPKPPLPIEHLYWERYLQQLFDVYQQKIGQPI